MGGGLPLPYSRQAKKATSPFWLSSSMVNGVNGAEIHNLFALFCSCERKVVLRMTRTQRNPGRAFNACPLPKVDELPEIFKVPDISANPNVAGSEEIMKAELMELIGKVDTLAAEVRMLKFGAVVMCVV